MTKFDIVVPCYNYGQFLERCVRSVLEQSLENLRVLIIDDASSDNSLCVAQRLAHGDQRVSVISHPLNWGHISTYNQGIAWASADYFLLLSADDLLVSGALERAAAIMEANPDVVLTHGVGIPWYNDLLFPEIDAKNTYTWSRQDLVGEMCATGRNIVSTPTAVARTRIQKEIGGYRASLPHTGDMEMWLRFAAHGAVARINTAQAIYRKHSLAMSNVYVAEILLDYQQRKEAFDSFFDEFSNCLPKSGTLRARASRALARGAFESGVGSLRRGRLNSGYRLLRWSMELDPRLRYFPPFWQLLRIPGPEGREWASSVVSKAVGKTLRRT